MYKPALVFNMLHLGYFLLTTNINLFPFNNIKSFTLKQRLLEGAIHDTLMLYSVIALLVNNKVMILIAVCYLGFLLIGEYLSWWQYYLFGPTEKWKTFYDKVFKDTIKILPAIKDNPIPNLEHCILHLVTLITLIVTLMYYISL